MKELVDTIIDINFNEINDVVFPMNELFGLVINLNNVKYEFLLNIVEDSDFLLSVGSGHLMRTLNMIEIDHGLIDGLGDLRIQEFFIMTLHFIWLQIFMAHGVLEQKKNGT